MAKPLRRPPAASEVDYARAREYFDDEIFKALLRVGTATFAPGTIGAGATVTFTVTVQEARPNEQQQVQVGPPASLHNDLIFSGLVTADDTVTVRVHNLNAVGIDPGSAIWGVRVMP